MSESVKITEDRFSHYTADINCRKLKAAKEKLKHLQSLVAMVQHAPDSAGTLPDNIAELAASMEDGESQFTQADDRNNASLSEGEVPTGQAQGQR